MKLRLLFPTNLHYLNSISLMIQMVTAAILVPVNNQAYSQGIPTDTVAQDEVLPIVLEKRCLTGEYQQCAFNNTICCRTGESCEITRIGGCIYPAPCKPQDYLGVVACDLPGAKSCCQTGFHACSDVCSDNPPAPPPQDSSSSYSPSTTTLSGSDAHPTSDRAPSPTSLKSDATAAGTDTPTRSTSIPVNTATASPSTSSSADSKKSGFDGWETANKVGLVLGIITSVITIGAVIGCWKAEPTKRITARVFHTHN